MEADQSNITRAADLLQKLRGEIGKALVGQTAVVDQVIATLVASA